MPDINVLADSMLGAASTVLGRLVEMPVAASGTTRNDHAGSIRVDGADELVTLAHIPSLAISVVVRFNAGEIARIVNLMLGGGDEAAEMGAMQLSIVSETVSQISVAMSEQLAREIGASTDGITAELCNDATVLPPPPFESYEGMVQIGSEVAPQIAIDFDGIAVAKISGGASTHEIAAPVPQPVAAAPAPAAAAPAKARAAQLPVDARAVSFTPMTPTAARGSAASSNLDLVHDVPLQISAVLGRTALTLRDVVALQTGSVFELDKLSSEPIDLYVNNILIARGEVVVVDDKFAVKISELNPQVG
jgi:flagellar motor switch protein FliN